jgi:1-acyl-sn-glycerol-3-phosphate acyltransferase
MMAPSLDIMAHAAVETLRISVPTIIEAALGSVSSQACDERLDSWSRNLLQEAGLYLHVQGREHLVAGEPYVVMSNHQSHYDIPVLFRALRIPMRMVAKKEIFRIPFMAGAMRAAGFVEVDREHQRSAMESLTTAHDRLSESISVWIAPEGTRSRTGRLGPFRRGGFRIAIRSGVRILPVTIDGTRKTLPAGRLTVCRGNWVTVTISPPINSAHYGLEGMNKLMICVREAIVRHLPEAVD